MVRCKPCCQELVLGYCHQVKMNGRGAGGVMAWRSHAQQGYRTPRGIERRGFRSLAKELIRAREAPLKRLLHLLPHFITTHADRRAKHGQQALRLRTTHAAHLPYGLFDDAR
jgi:hypothetical protein